MYSIDTVPEAATLLDHEPSTAHPILVATDGSESSDPALVSALLLNQKIGGVVHVAAIHQPVPPMAYELAVLPAVLEAEEGRREDLRRDVEAQVRRIVGEDHREWTIMIRDGDPATELARLAIELDPRVVLMGVKHRHFSDRLFGRETALRMMQFCRSPLLIVPVGFAHLPRRALFATDFSPASLDALRTALRLFDSIEEITLMHVTPSPVPPPQLFGTWQEWLDEDTNRGFEWVRAELALPPSTRVETVTHEGHAAREITTVARDRGVDLIVTGTRGAGMLNRLLIGSTARGIVHGAECAVLVVRPHAQTNAPYPLLEPERAAVDHNQWATVLADFSKRNVGRRTTLEVDDPQLGAQTQEENYFFQGAAYDPQSQQVEIMVGDFTGTQRHLTRNITGVKAIHVLRDAADRDWILRIAHGDGQTLLTLHR